MDGVQGLLGSQIAAGSLGRFGLSGLFSLLGLAAYFLVLVPRLSRQGQSAVLMAMVCAAVALGWSRPADSLWTFSFLLALAFGHLGRWTAQRATGADAARMATVLASSDGAAESANDAVPSAGKTLGRYRVERQIGKGAMGAVYLATDPKISRSVAIKTLALSRDFEGEELANARARFFREAELAGRLKHPDIVTIFDADEDQGLAFIAMEFLTGHDLVPYTQARKLLPVPQVLTLVARVARALAHAHSLGVVHRDIKPANVMIDVATDVVKVTDFGIAQVCDAARTRTGIVMGSPLYMSPEQLSGERLDGRSDLYSLGVMLYQLLTGRLPHESSSMGTLLRQIAQDAAPDVRSIRPELPAALADVVALALQKRAAYRYADGLQMAADLHAVLLLLNPSPPPPSPHTRRLAAVQATVDAQVVPPSSDLEATVRLA
jgi:eukaryotic-like serine/threonine-protein kinase